MSQNLNNSQVAAYVNRTQPFSNKNGTMWASWYGDSSSNRYVVCSYGPHWPMYIWCARTRQWYGNKDKRSATTSRHMTQARPKGKIKWLSVYHMYAISQMGTLGFLKERVKG
jgi:hypothetical protein